MSIRPTPTPSRELPAQIAVACVMQRQLVRLASNAALVKEGGMAAKDYCSRRPVTIDASASIADAAALLAREDVGCLVVTDGKRPVGMLTDRDVVFRVLLEETNPERDCVADVMRGPVQTLPADAELEVAFTALRTHRLRRLPLVDAEGALVGILAVDDLLRFLSTEIGDMAEAIRRQLGSGSSALAVPS